MTFMHTRVVHAQGWTVLLLVNCTRLCLDMNLIVRLCVFASLIAVGSAFAPFLARNVHATRTMNLEMGAQIDVSMPALSSTMKEGKIVSWNKKIGDKVNSGDVLLVVESDKADMDVESFEGGYLAAIYTPEGQSAPVGSVVAVLVEDVADISKVGSTPGGSAAKIGAPPAASAVTPTSPKAAPATTSASNAPAFEPITMPALSSTMKQGKIVSWSKKVGDKVSSGDMVLVVESDKADMDVESFDEGYLAAIVVKDGEMATVGAPVGYLTKTSAEIAGVQAYLNSGGVMPAKAVDPNAAEPFQVIAPTPAASASTSGASAASAAASKAPAVVNSGRVSASGYAQSLAKDQGINLSTVTPSRPDGYIIAKDLSTGAKGGYTHVPAAGTINASPSARKLAADNKLDVTKIAGSGNFGRVMPDDVLKAAGKYVPPKSSVSAAVPSAAAVASSKPAASAGAPTAALKSGDGVVLDGLVAMDGMQKAVAKNMEKTLSVPVFRVSREIVTDDFDALYATLKAKGVTVSALLAKAVAEVLKKHPLLNAAYDPSGAIKFNKDINIAMAVAIEGGLITPTIVKASEMDLFSISRTWKDLVAKAKAKKLTPAEYTTGTFTISNLGMFGVKEFGAILPPGTGSILAIAAAHPKVVQLPNGHFGVQKTMTVTITCDHRHIYGADAAEFLKDLADLLENNVQSLTMG